MMKTTSKVLFAAFLLAALTGLPARAAVHPLADILFVVDESSSMGGEHAWINGIVSSLDAKLGAAGVTDAKFGLVGFGHTGGPSVRSHTDFTSLAAFQTAAAGLVTSGSFEDGYLGIDYGLNNLGFRAGAALNVILISDEDRDISRGSTLTYDSILGELTKRHALLNVVGDFSLSTLQDNFALGHDSKGNAHRPDGAGGYTSTELWPFPTGAGSSVADYYDMALATGGAAWDLGLLRSGGDMATSFTAAFVDIKVGEIITQIPSNGGDRVPDAGSTAAILLAALGSLVAIRHRAMI